MDSLFILVDAPVFAWQLLINGVLVGAIFALAAYGLALVWGVMNIINVTQGEFVILGGFITLYLSLAGIHPIVGIPVAAVALFFVGWVIYKIVIFRIVDRDLFTSLLATFGISILLQQLMNEIFGADVQTAQTDFGTILLFDGMVTVANIQIVSFVLALVLGVVLVIFLKRSRMGQTIRATAQNAQAARIMGIDPDRVFAFTYSLNAAICGAAGALVVMTWVIHPFLGLTYTVRSFMIVIVAGLGNLAGVVAAGLGLGALEKFAGFILGAEFEAAFVFSLLVVILVLRNLAMSRKRKYLK